MWEIIRKNKIKSAIALAIMTIWYCAVYGLISAIFVFSFILKLFNEKAYEIGAHIYYAIGIIIVLIIFICVFKYKEGGPYEFEGYVLHKSRKSVNKQLHNIVEEIVIASGLNIIPKIYILDTDILNAYACGINPKKASIVVSKGLMETLTRDELQGVIAHEIGHIVNRDTTYLLCSGIMYTISASCTHEFYESAKGGGRGAGAALLMALISSIGQFICFLLLLFVSRKREYIADASACIYTRYPKGLADALLKIEKSYQDNKIFSLHHRFIRGGDYLLKSSFIFPIENKKDSIFSTHPSTTNRIGVLLNMRTADAIEYERSFRKLNNSKKLLPKSAIKESKKIQIRETANDNLPLEIAVACALNSTVDDNNVKIMRANKDIIEENIERHRIIQDIIYELDEYIRINCECGTILKIPNVYKNTIVICPHCKKKHPVGVKVE